VRHLYDIIKSFIGSVLFAIVAFITVYFDLGRYLPLIKSYNIELKLGFVSLFLSILIIVSLFVWVYLTRRPLFIKNGRRGAMEANAKILKIKEPKDRVKRYILSTRVSFWPPWEDENARSEFRNILTEKIRGGIRVERIWQIHISEDLSRLITYLELYKSYDNYSVKCFVGKNAFIPEILSVHGKVVSVSIPQAEAPNRLTTAFHFRGKNEILRWESYFKILWEQSIPIKVGSRVLYDKIEELKNALR